MQKLISNRIEFSFCIRIVFILAILFNIISVILHLNLDYFASKQDSLFSTLIWLLSIVFLSFCVLKIARQIKKTQKNNDLSLYEKVGLILIILFAFITRFSLIKYFGFYEIEWYWLQEAKRIVSGFVSPFGFFGDFPSNNLAFPIAFLLTFLKDRFLIIRLPVITYSILTIIFTFKYFKTAFNKSVAFISAILLSSSIWDINAESLGWHNANSIPFLISSNMFFLYEGIQSNNLTSILISGIISGFAINTLYIPSLIVIPSMILLLIKIYNKNTQKFALLSLLIYLITIFFVISPNIAKIKKYPFSLVRQKNSFSVNYNRFTENKNNNYYLSQGSIVLNNLFYVKNKFSTYGLWVTTLDPVISSFLFIGFFYFLIKITSLNHLFTFLNFLIMLIPIVIFDREGSTWREFGLFIGIYMIASVTIFYYAKFMDQSIKRLFYFFSNEYSHFSRYWLNKILVIILLIYLIIFGFLYNYYLKSQFINKQHSEESFFIKNAEFIKKSFPKQTLIYLTNDFPGRVISITTEEKFKIKYFSAIQNIDINIRPLTIVLSFGKGYYWSNQFSNYKNFEQYVLQSNQSYKKFRLDKNADEFTLIYYFN